MVGERDLVQGAEHRLGRGARSSPPAPPGAGGRRPRSVDPLVRGPATRPHGGSSDDGLAGRVSDSGEGRWTVKSAVDIGVPAPVLAASLSERFASRGEDHFANQVLSAMRQKFGGHQELPDGDSLEAAGAKADHVDSSDTAR